MLNLLSLLLVRKTFNLDVALSEENFKQALATNTQRLIKLPYGGFNKSSHDYLLEAKKSKYVIKKNVPHLQYLRFLPGSVRYVFKIVSRGDHASLVGYSEPRY